MKNEAKYCNINKTRGKKNNNKKNNNMSPYCSCDVLKTQQSNMSRYICHGDVNTVFLTETYAEAETGAAFKWLSRIWQVPEAYKLTYHTGKS